MHDFTLLFNDDNDGGDEGDANDEGDNDRNSQQYSRTGIRKACLKLTARGSDGRVSSAGISGLTSEYRGDFCTALKLVSLSSSSLD